MIALVLAHPAGRARLPSRRVDARRAGRESDVCFDSLYTYAWFVTFGLSFVLYLALSRSPSHANVARERMRA